MIKQIKYALILAAMMVAGNAGAQYQITNSNFDEWESVTGNGETAEEPVHWNSFLTATGSYYSTIASNQLSKETGRTGTGYCAKLTARSVMGIAWAQGNLTTGQINGGSMSATDASGNYNFTNVDESDHNMPFTGRPDAVKVWVKYHGEVSSYPNAKVSVFLHGNGYYQDPNTANTSKLSECIAQAYVTPSSCDWTELTIPFTYSSTNRPTYVLASFATNSQPGQGTANDYMYVDDMEMVYYSDIKSASFNGTAITFNGTSATVDGDYKEKYLKITSGAGADIEYDFNKETYLLTVTIKGDNYSEDNTNYHVYTIQFSGVASENDDEPDAVITPETEIPSVAPTAGWFYIKNHSTGNYITTGTVTNSTPHRWYINSTDVYDASGNHIQISAGLTTHTVNTSATGKDLDILFAAQTGGYQIYGMKSSWGTYYTYINDDGGKINTKSSSSTADNYLWEFIDADLYDRVNGFWKNYQNASLTNGVDASAFIKHNADNGVDAQIVSGLPLGLYKLGDGSIQYLSSGADLEVAAGQSTLTYYGRLNLTPIATYNGKTVENNNVSAAYYKDKLSIGLNNGADKYEVYYDNTTRIATVTVSGYGRSRDTEIQFAAPDTKLYATYMGEDIVSEGSVDEEYTESNLSVTLGDGIASYATSFDDNTGVLTITLTDIFGETTAHTVNFLPTTPATESTKDYYNEDDDDDVIASTLDDEELTADSETNYVQIATLENGNISVTIKNLTYDDTNYGDITAQNLEVSSDGRFLFKGSRRLGDGTEKLPILFNGQIKDGKLCGKFTVTTADGTYVLTSNMTVDYEDTYDEDLLVSVNGTTLDKQTADVTVVTLESGNINFVLNNFYLGDTQPVGSINMENLSVDADGNFSFDGKVSIAAGDDDSEDWLGPTLGELDLTMRGTRDENTNSLVAILNIVLPGQNVHVALGATPESTREFTDNVNVSVNGETPTVVKDSKVTVGTLKNGNINFTLNNFYLGTQGVGNISIENLALDADGNFAYNGDIMITKGTGESDTYEWLGTTLGFIPINMTGKMSGDGLTAVIDITIPDQNIHVTFGATPTSTESFTDDVTVCVNGQTPTVVENNNVTVGHLANGNINFTLNDFYLGTQGVGNISIENLAVDADGNFAYNGDIMITKGSDDSKDWLGPTLGFIPVELRGTMRNGGMTVAIDIVIPEQNIHVTFGATDTTDRTYTEDITVVVNSSDPMVQEDQNVVVGTLKNGNINFSLKNFYLQGAGVGNISIENLALDSNGSFSYNGNILITKGTSESDSYDWLGPKLGFVPIDMKGTISGSNLHATISIELPDQSVKVEVGSAVVTIESLAKTIAGLKTGTTTLTDVQNMVNKILGK